MYDIIITNADSNKPLRMFDSNGITWNLFDWCVEYFDEEPSILRYEEYVPENEQPSKFIHGKYGPFILGNLTGVVWSRKRK